MGEDHVTALAAYRAGCGVNPERNSQVVCARAGRETDLGETAARRFFERYFRFEPIDGTGLLTAYYTPVFEARSQPSGAFTAPIRPRPADLTGAPHADRAAIEARDAADALGWMRPEDLFFLQIQGSGVLVFGDGARFKAVFDGANGAPFVGLARPMLEQGLIADADTSAETIHAWLAAHRGARADAMMRLDPRYVFFHLAPDDGAAPAGAAGVTLIAGRSLAVDPTRHGFGELLWIDATAPALTGALPGYRRLAMTLDAGAAIKGNVRADLYLGEGAAAGLEAGRVRHVLRLWRLRPVEGSAP
jgi:membrane-bound lytic murein transglycosylase A